MKRLVVILIFISIILNLFTIGYPMFSRGGMSPLILGRSLAGTVSLLIQGQSFNIFIYSPYNQTYYADNITGPFPIQLNVSADETVDTWWYTLKDISHNSIVEENVIFTPNTTFYAVKRLNKIEVYANDSSGNVQTNNVFFYVSTPFNSPILSDFPSKMYACESTSNFSYEFNATDLNEDPLQFSLTPSNPFYVSPSDWTEGGEEVVEANLISTSLMKSHVGIHNLTVQVTDGGLSDSKATSVEVIGINNPPSVANIGTKTVWTHGDNSTFAYQVRVLDIEEGTEQQGDFTYNLTFLSGTPFFSISETGFMNISPDESQIGVYDLRVCVTDNGIDNPHENISLCGQTGAPLTSCRYFSLTVTNANRAPSIILYSPSELNFSINGQQRVYLNITKYDPDQTIPDAYWYVDGVLKQYNLGENYKDNFEHVFGCDVSGLHTIKAEITDGLLNASLQWNITIKNIPCQGGGGGGGGGGACVEKWVCDEWSECQELNYSFEFGSNVSATDFLGINLNCTEQGIPAENCGFQIRECLDLNNCTNKRIKVLSPSKLQSCYFTPNPTCLDGLRNCHDGSCEILTDCGGPCPACPSCSDGIQNQAEQGVDCGGPCPAICPPETPLRMIPLWIYLVIFIILILLIIIFILVKRIFLIIKEDKKETILNLISYATNSRGIKARDKEGNIIQINGPKSNEVIALLERDGYARVHVKYSSQNKDGIYQSLRYLGLVKK